MPNYLEQLEALRPVFQKLFGEMILFFHQNDNVILLEEVRKISEEWLSIKLPSGYALKTSWTFSDSKFDEIRSTLRANCPGLSERAQQKLEGEMANIKFLQATQGVFIEKSLNSNDLKYFWLALIVNNKNLNLLEAFACYLAIQDVLTNPILMSAYYVGVSPSDKTVTYEFYEKLKGRRDHLIGGPFYGLVLQALAASCQVIKDKPLTELQQLFPETNYPLSGSMLQNIELSYFCWAACCIENLAYLFYAKQPAGASPEAGFELVRETVVSALAARIGRPVSFLKQQAPTDDDEREVKRETVQATLGLNLEFLDRLKIFLEFMIRQQVSSDPSRAAALSTLSARAGAAGASSVPDSPAVSSPIFSRIQSAIPDGCMSPLLRATFRDEVTVVPNPLFRRKKAVGEELSSAAALAARQQRVLQPLAATLKQPQFGSINLLERVNEIIAGFSGVSFESDPVDASVAHPAAGRRM